MRNQAELGDVDFITGDYLAEVDVFRVDIAGFILIINDR